MNNADRGVVAMMLKQNISTANYPDEVVVIDSLLDRHVWL
jgi:hypothetical protein